MPVTVQSLRDVIKHTLGGEPADGASYSRIINGAGKSFAAANSWYWLSHREATLTATPGSEWVELPADFAGVHRVYVSGAYYEEVRMTTPQELLDWKERSSGITTPYPYIGTIQFRTDADAGQLPWLRVYPAPTTADTYSLLYDARWADVDDGTSVVGIPPFLEYIFEEWVRAYARGLDEEDAMPLMDRLAQLKASEAFMDAQRRDAESTGTMITPTDGNAGPMPTGFLRVDLGGV